MGLIQFGLQLVAAVGFYSGFQWLVRYPSPTRPYRSCLKEPTKEFEPKLEPAKPTFPDSVKVLTKTLKKAVRVLGWGKAVKIQATPTRVKVVFRWIDKKKHCFRRKRRRAPKRCSDEDIIMQDG